MSMENYVNLIEKVAAMSDEEYAELLQQYNNLQNRSGFASGFKKALPITTVMDAGLSAAKAGATNRINKRYPSLIPNVNPVSAAAYGAAVGGPLDAALFGGTAGAIKKQINLRKLRKKIDNENYERLFARQNAENNDIN